VNGDDDVGRIATRCGYDADADQFNRVFKRIFGMSASEFRDVARRCLPRAF
jgi:transcriptional regulator GlxA family with amidase domain